MEYIKKIDLLSKAVEVEYLGRPRMMVSVAQIGEMPSVDFEPKQGEWEERYVEDDCVWTRRRFYCSACGGWNTYGKSRYCPNCGARMARDEDRR